MGQVSNQSPPPAAKHDRQSMILMEFDAATNDPAKTGIEIVRPLTVFGYDDAPHGH